MYWQYLLQKVSKCVFHMLWQMTNKHNKQHHELGSQQTSILLVHHKLELLKQLELPLAVSVVREVHVFLYKIEIERL